MRDIHVPEVDQIELPNGLKLYLLEDHSLPKVEGVALIRTGDRFEPADKVGLASIVGQVMRTGGTANFPGEEIDRMLENAGAVVETGIGTSSGSASIFALREDLPMTLEILADLLRNPAFPEDKIELSKVQERTAISRRNDNVMGIASREFLQILYGPESPYGRTTEYATIDAITREDLVAFPCQVLPPQRDRLGSLGRFRYGPSQSARRRVFRFLGKDKSGLSTDIRGPDGLERLGQLHREGRCQPNESPHRTSGWTSR